MQPRIIMPVVAPDADRRFTPGPCVIYQPLPERTNGGLPRVPKINGKSLATILAKKRYEESLKQKRRSRNAEASAKATAAQAPRFERLWAQLQADGHVVDGEVTVHALAAAAVISASTLFSRMYRFNVPRRRTPPPRGNTWVTKANAKMLVTYNAGNLRGRVNNPKTKKAK